MTSLAVKLIAGSAERKTRLHTTAGEIVPVSRLLRNAPGAVVTGVGRVLFGARPPMPWISYDAQKVIAAHLSKRSRVLEFGSGMSTLWYAQRAGSVHSVENNAEWYRLVKPTLPDNATIALAESREAYLDFPRQEYDLIMVDGRWRNRCVATALPFLASGGILYLDNSDREQYAEAVQLMEARGPVRHFVDFAPTQMFVQRGTMLTLP